MRIFLDHQNSYTQKHHYVLHPIYINTLSVLIPKLDKVLYEVNEESKTENIK